MTITLLFYCFFQACKPANQSKKEEVVPEKEIPVAPEKIKAPDTASYDPLIDSLLRSRQDFFGPYLDRKEAYRIQIIYTQINRNQQQEPVFTHHYYRYLPGEYVNPASLVKLPALLVALEKLKKLNIEGLNRETPFEAGKDRPCQEALVNDPSAPQGKPTIGHIARQMMLVSDDKAYTKMYEFTGQEYLNQRLEEVGWDHARIVYRFASKCNEEENKYTNSFRFYKTDGTLLYEQPATFNTKAFPAAEKLYIGTYDIRNGDTVAGGRDFGSGNRLSLMDMHTTIASLVFPRNKTYPLAFDLRPEDLEFVRKYIALYPREAEYPMYDSLKFYDSFCNYFLYGQKTTHISNPDIRVFNMVGQTFGWLIDCAYIVDFAHHKECMLTAVIFANEDGIIGDGKYEYDSKGFPFLRELGKLFLEYEQGRHYPVKPDLKDLQDLFKQKP